MARSSGMVVHPLAAGRSPTDDFFLPYCYPLGLLDRERTAVFVRSPKGGGGGSKKRPLEMDIPIRSSGFFWHPRLSVGQPFLFDANILLFPVVGKRYPNFFIYGVERPLSR